MLLQTWSLRALSHRTIWIRGRHMGMLELKRAGIVDYVDAVRRRCSGWGFLHIHKTAGTSLIAEIGEHASPCYLIRQGDLSTGGQAKRDDEWAAVLAFARQQKSLSDDRKYRFWAGHLRNVHVQYLKAEFPGTHCFAMVREPASMVVSAYRHLLTAHPRRKEWSERYPTLEDYILESKVSRNVMVKRLAPAWYDNIEQTVNGILHYYDFIGTLELYSFSGSVIFQMMNLVRMPSAHLNKAQESTDERFMPTPEMIERIRALNAADVALHQTVTQILEARQTVWWRHFRELQAAARVPLPIA